MHITELLRFYVSSFFHHLHYDYEIYYNDFLIFKTQKNNSNDR